MRFPIGFSVTGTVLPMEEARAGPSLVAVVRRWLEGTGAVVTRADALTLEFSVPLGDISSNPRPIGRVDGGRITIAEHGTRLELKADFSTRRLLSIAILSATVGAAWLTMGAGIRHLPTTAALVVCVFALLFWHGYRHAKSGLEREVREVLARITERIGHDP
jgi:hypothetical protein